MVKSIYREEHQRLVRTVRELRQSAGLSQADLAPRLGRAQNRISDLERCGRRIDVIEFIDFGEALGKSPLAVLRAFLSQSREN